MSVPATPDSPATLPIADGDWSVDGEDSLLAFTPEPPPFAEPARAQAEAVLPVVATPTAAPPSPEQIVEAMLFTGNAPLTSDAFCSAVRVPPDVFRLAMDALTRKYKSQNRPYAIQPVGDGFALVVKPAYLKLREKLYGGPRETRLTQPALDTLSLVAYRQPIRKSEVEATRGADSASVLRWLVRLGLIAVTQRGDATQPEVRYGTTPRFLELFHLRSLEDLPQLGEARAI